MSMLTKHLGITDYRDVFAQMQAFTAARTPQTPDELWLTQHRPVFTQGQAGKPEHILRQPDIPIVQSDRGGQVTYHGEGQIVLYTLIDIKRAGLGVRQMVTLIEDSLVATLATLGIIANADPKAPGVYVQGKKIASLGLRVRRGRTYHGLALNVDMDLTPFSFINPCGYQGLQMTQVSEWVDAVDFAAIEQQLVEEISRRCATS